MDVGRMLKGEPSVQFQREDKKRAKSAETLINILYVHTYVHNAVVRGIHY